ncbi:MAG: hypothetical protein GY838_12005 [bacterium]|nr:hypothetical protein [bacterium]
MDVSDRLAARLSWLLVIGVPALALLLGHGALQTPDGLSYLGDVRDGVDLVHPHHALYGLLLAAAAGVLSPLGVGPLAAGQVLGAVTTGLVLAAGLQFAWRRLDPRSALLAVALLAGLRGFPVHTVRLEVYLTLMAAGAWLCAVCTSDRPGTLRRTAAIGTLLATAALAHQMGALLAVPVLVTPWAGWRLRLAAVGGAGALALAGYGAGFAWGQPSGAEDGFVSWLITYAQAPVDDWGTFGHWDLAGLAALFGNIGRMMAPVPAGWGWLAALGVGLGTLALVVTGWRRARGTGDAQALRFLLVWLAVQLVFVLWWLPLDTDFAVPSLWPLWALGIVAVRGLDRRRSGVVLAGVAALLLVVNLGLGLPRLVRQGEAERVRAMAYDLAEPIPDDYSLRQHLRWYRQVDLPAPEEAMAPTSP